ncbi:hypothetical protein MMC07_006081 [Pseudocyphellaria aurata]|nr:hypothetical protein [Pseudocyphellaria aurata]
MEEHPRKRRKTSPLTSVTLNFSNTPTRAASEDGSRSIPTRNLYMSPTKASLARFNPHLLPQHISAEKKQQNQACRQSQSFEEKERPGPNAGKKMGDDIFAAPQQNIQAVRVGDLLESVEGGPMLSLGLGTTSNGEGSNLSPRKTRTPSMELPSARQRQAEMAQDLRASPPEASANEEQIPFDTIPDHQTSGSQRTISEPMNPVIDTIEIEVEKADLSEPVLPFTPSKSVLKDTEPRLPSTPRQLGLEPLPSPPKGLFFHNTRRKPKRKKRSEVKSSPLKPIAPSPAIKSAEFPRESGLGPRILVTNTLQPKATQPNGRRKKTHKPAASSLDSSVDFSPTLPTLSQRLALFLPFSKPPISNADPPPPVSTGQKDLGALHIDSTEITTCSTTSHDPTLKHQSVALTSPQQLPVVKFQLSTNIETGKNTDLIISSIVTWANLELGPWLRTDAVRLDKPIIERTISRYWELSEMRACCWYRCEADLPTQNLSSDTTTTSPTNPHTLASHSFPQNPVPTPIPTPPPHPLHPHLGQRSILFTSSPSPTTKISLLITWHLTISPAGTVTSDLSAHATFPDPWLNPPAGTPGGVPGGEAGGVSGGGLPGGGVLGGVPGGEALGRVNEVFDALVEEVGVLQAVKVLWGAIFGR